MLRFSSVCLLGLSLIGPPLAAAAEAPDGDIQELSWKSTPEQLNTEAFADCLAAVRASPSADERREIRRGHGLHTGDLLLLHLSVYPGKLLPFLSLVLQPKAREHWSGRWDTQEEALAHELSTRVDNRSPITLPSELFSESLTICGGQDVFCAALLAHNVLRTLGRYQQGVHKNRDFNPLWFQQARKFWVEQAPKIQGHLIGLRKDQRGDRWGEWYHFFGILTYATRAKILNRSSNSVAFVSEMNELLNPLLAGGQEDPPKVRVDHDSVVVATRYLNQQTGDSHADCRAPEAFVH